MKLPNGFEFPYYEDEYMMFGMLFVLGNKLQAVGDSFYDEITSKQWLILIMLEVFGENHPTLNELADAMGSSHQNTKQIILKLETKGYVELYADKKDKRKMRIRRTAKIDDLAQKYKDNEEKFMKKLYRGIDKTSIAVTINTLLDFEKNLEELKDGKDSNI
jgi:DNA-binding MarR family transcriptional regulator